MDDWNTWPISRAGMYYDMTGVERGGSSTVYFYLPTFTLLSPSQFFFLKVHKTSPHIRAADFDI